MTADPREIHRTRPDYVIHDPTGGRERPWGDDEFYWLNEHILVHPLGDGSLLATWTAERLDAPCLMRIGVKRSTDGGDSWSPLVWADGRGVGGDGQAAAWQVPLESPDGRVYLLYTQSRDSRSAIPESSTGGRSGNVAISERLPPMASTVLRSVESSRSLRCSSRETPSWLMPSWCATLTWVSCRALRSSRTVISSAISSAARSSTLRRRAGSSLEITSFTSSEDRDRATEWLRSAIWAGQHRFVEADPDFPKKVWCYEDGQTWLGLCVNTKSGEYKGWPIDEEERRAIFD